MKRAARNDPGARQLALVLAALFLALALPSAVLVVQAQRQLEWEAFHQYRVLAESLAARVDESLQRAVAAEESRSAGDYRFLVVGGELSNATAVQRSPLARWPVQSDVPGVLGYFQVEADGTFSTPTLPASATSTAPDDVDATEWSQRIALRSQILGVLDRNALLPRSRAPAANESADKKLAAGADAGAPDSAGANAQSGFDELATNDARGNASQRQSLGRVTELKLDRTYQEANAAPPVAQSPKQQAKDPGTRAKRKEQNAILEDAAGADAAARVRIFESELDPFVFTLLDDGHGVFHRTVWRDGRRTVQGAIVDQRRFLDGALVGPFRETALAEMSDLLVAYRGDVIDVTRGATGASYAGSAEALRGELLHQVRLSAPFADFQILWSINRLPPGPGARVVAWASLVLLAVLVFGLIALWRLGRRQLRLAAQQRDFVSAVSHELKTPLTSIRMYAEMLREGWVGADKQREYFGFIHDESERLSRLIANVLQLARLERSELDLKPSTIGVKTLVDTLRSRLGSQIEQGGFTAQWTTDPGVAEAEVFVDLDAVVQIAINLVDNALKFAAAAQRRAVDVTVRARGTDAIELGVRDYGPGVPKAEMRRIFDLFFRAGSELTRETVGTGIGLALVRQLARAMGGDVDVVNREPGAEFTVTLPRSRPLRSRQSATPGNS